MSTKSREVSGWPHHGRRYALKSHVAAAFNNKRPGKIDWTDRCGVIERIAANKVHALVIWDCQKTPDELSITGIEPA